MVRAVVQETYGTEDVLTVGEVDTPSVGPDQVLLEVHAAAIDRGTRHLMTGTPRLLRLFFGLRRPRRRVPGLDAAGTVVEVGSSVTRWAVGQEVFGIARGSLAERTVADATKLAAAPPGLSAPEAAALGISGLTALQALDAARVDEGGRVLVIGASGGVGSFVVKMAAIRGLRVTAVCSAAKADWVRSWGADRVIDHAVEDPTSGSETYDAVIDIAGVASLAALRRVTSPTGTIVFVGAESGGEWTGGYGRPMRQALRMLPARQRFVMLTSREDGADLARIAELVTDHGLRPHLHAVHGLDDVRAAMRSLGAGEVCGKIALDVSGRVRQDP